MTFLICPLAQATSAGQPRLSHVIADIREVGRVGLGYGVHDISRVTRHTETAHDKHVAGTDPGGGLLHGDLRNGSHIGYTGAGG